MCGPKVSHIFTRKAAILSAKAGVRLASSRRLRFWRAHHFARANVDWAVFEVGLGGQFDATNAWDSKIAVLTAVHLDHTDVLGNTLCEIAADKVHIARSGRPLFTGSGQAAEVLKLLERECALRGVALHVVDAEMDDMADRPVTSRENAALSVCCGASYSEWVRDVVAR